MVRSEPVLNSAILGLVSRTWTDLELEQGQVLRLKNHLGPFLLLPRPLWSDPCRLLLRSKPVWLFQLASEDAVCPTVKEDTLADEAEENLGPLRFVDLDLSLLPLSLKYLRASNMLISVSSCSFCSLLSGLRYEEKETSMSRDRL